jgi:hypothetical protein
MVLYYLVWKYRSRGDATAAGAEAFRAVAPKSVEKNIMRISLEQKKNKLSGNSPTLARVRRK